MFPGNVDTPGRRPVDGRTSVLIIDDDPMHLRIYGWIIDQAGYEARPALVTVDRVEFPVGPVDIVVLDYRLTGQLTAVDAAVMVNVSAPSCTTRSMASIRIFEPFPLTKPRMTT